nr:Arc family DNA-binding protein [Nocardioides ochotonae]
MNPQVADAVRRWADDELRSVNAQIEKILHDALLRAGRLPGEDPDERAGG